MAIRTSKSNGADLIDGRVEIRGCTSQEELVEVVALCDAAFPKTPKDYFERHVLRDRTLSPEDTRILVKDRTIVSSVQVFPRTIYLQGKNIDFGGIGNVATLPAERRHGYAAVVMQNALNYIRGKGLPISLLTTTINEYYEKFGFKTIKRCVMLIHLPGGSADDHARRFDRERDLEKLMRLYERYNAESTGPVVRDRKYWLTQLDFCGEDTDLFYVEEDGEEILGFVRAKRALDRIQVWEYGYAHHEEKIIQRLFGHLAFETNLLTLEVFASESEKRRLPFGECSSFRTDTDMMINFLDEGLDPQARARLLGDCELTFWLTDFF